jgi:hypothetical protein
MALDGQGDRCDPKIVEDLVLRGILVFSSRRIQGPSRRQVVSAAALGVGVGISALSLPSVASASSNSLPVELTGTFQSAEWNNPPADSAITTGLGFISTDIVSAVLPDSDLPFSSSPTGPRVSGTLVVDENSYDVEAWDYQTAGSAPLFFMLLTPDLQTESGGPFVLTFSYNGVNYRMTESVA